MGSFIFNHKLLGQLEPSPEKKNKLYLDTNPTQATRTVIY